MVAKNDFRKGALLMSLAMVVFATQDGASRYLSENYSVELVLMIRFWFYAAFAIALAARQPGGIREQLRSKKPIFQSFRVFILIVEIYITVLAFVKIGLINTISIFMSYPLMVAVLSVPFLGEKIGWRRWSAISFGFIGILIILQPSKAVFSSFALIPLLSAFLFACYGVATRYVAYYDDAMKSFFWTGIVGAICATIGGIYSWEPIARHDMIWMVLLSLSGILGHFLLIKAYEIAEASSIQPFCYLHLVFITFIGISFFNETVTLPIFIGALFIVGAGLFTFWRTHISEQ